MNETLNITDDYSYEIERWEPEAYFFVKQEWLIQAYFWLPSLLFGLPINILIIAFGKQTKSLGNFQFAISAISMINALHCVARGIVLSFYFACYYFSFKITLVSCTIVANVFNKWSGLYIVFYIPLLAGYRYLLLYTKTGEYYLTKARIIFAIFLMTIVPTISIAGRGYYLVSDMSIGLDNVCSYKFSDSTCQWCTEIITFGCFITYGIAAFIALLLVIRLYRTFRQVSRQIGPHNASSSSRRRFRDEIGILICIITETAIPIILTIPTNGRQYLGTMMVDGGESPLAAVVYNYNPLFNALLTIAFVKPYRRAFLKWTRLVANSDSSSTLAVQGTQQIRMSVMHQLKIPSARDNRKFILYSDPRIQAPVSIVPSVHEHEPHQMHFNDQQLTAAPVIQPITVVEL